MAGDNRPAKAAVPQLASLLTRSYRPLLTALLLTLILATIPRLPLGNDDDSSWSAVLDYAHHRGWQFGTDIAFSYGPLGFLITPYWSPSVPGLRIATDIALAFAVTAGLCLLLWRTVLAWRWLGIGLFTLLAANADPRSELLVFAGLLCWGLLCVECAGPSLVVAAAGLVALATFAALAKMTLLVPALLTIGAVAALFLLRGRLKFALGLSAGFLASFLATWLLLGQQLSNMKAFLMHGLVLSAGYDQAMWAAPFPPMLLPGVIMVLMTMTLIGLRGGTATANPDQRPVWQRTVLIAWLLGLLFVIWKHGFVRGGRDHLVVFLTLAPCLALVTEAVPSMNRKARSYSRLLGLGCCLAGLLAFNWLFAFKPLAFLGRPFLLGLIHARAFIGPRAYYRALGDLQEAEREANQLPRLREKIGRASVDVFGCNQAYALFNNLNYRPRPVFQSYAAYSAPLMDLNQQFYFSSAAPETVLFRLLPIDQRLPALEDAFLFRDLLINYRPLDLEGPFLLLQAKPRSSAPNLTLLKAGVLHPNEKLGLQDYGKANLWLELKLEPNLLGSARTFLYHPPEVALDAWRESAAAQMASFRAPAPMLAAGFLASPLLLDNRDVLDAYTGKAVIRPSAYTIELGRGGKYFWRGDIGYRLYRIENALGNSASPELVKLLDYPGFETAPAEVVANKQAFITVAGKPALFLPPDGFMRYVVPGTARGIQGEYGFAPAAYVLGGATQGAEFRIEQELSDGSLRLLHSQILRPSSRPEDRGLKFFSVPCPGTGTRKLLLRALPLAQNISSWDLTCWSEIGIK